MFTQFETSKGLVQGYFSNNIFVPTDKGFTLLQSMYGIEDDDREFAVENGWVKIPLSDGFYGSPEYKLEIEG